MESGSKRDITIIGNVVMGKTITIPWFMTGTDRDPKVGDKLYWGLRRRDGTLSIEQRNGVHLGCPDPACKCPKKF
jgi:hypothetical protein